MKDTSVGSFALEKCYDKHQMYHVPFEESKNLVGETRSDRAVGPKNKATAMGFKVILTMT
jgi:hypothetical protein